MVEWKTIGDTCIPLRKEIIKQGDLKDDGKYPVVNSGVSLYGYYKDYNNEGNAFTLASRGEYAGFVSYIKDKFWAGGLCYPYRSKNEALYLTKYIFGCLKNREQNIMDTLVMRGGIPALNKADVDKIVIPIPSLSEQTRIVGILDTFTSLISKLDEEIELRKQQFDFYKDKILAINSGIEIVRLKDVCEKTNNIKWKEVNPVERYKYLDLSGVSVETKSIERVLYINKENAPSRAQQLVKEGDVVVGTTRPTQKRICIIPDYMDNQICSTGFCVLRANTKLIHSKWIFYNLSQQKFWDYCEANQQGAGYPCITNTALLNYQIAIPSIIKQKALIEKLDAFTSLISKLEEERDLRQKQYEYYREKLLTFE